MITTIYDKLGWTCYLVTRQRRSTLWRTGHGSRQHRACFRGNVEWASGVYLCVCWFNDQMK